MNNIVENVPFSMFNEHFKIIFVVKDKIYYKKMRVEVKCVSCPGTKELTIDTRSNSNIRKHLSVSISQYYPLSIIITIIINSWHFNL